MSFSIFVAVRYLTARRKQAFISLISGVSILSVGVGVMALIIALALMTGLQGELRDRIIGSTAHIYVYNAGGDEFTDFPHDIAPLMSPSITGAAPALVDKALIKSSKGERAFVTLKGIDVAREPTVTSIRSSMITGSLDALTRTELPDGIVLGQDLADSLRVSVGDRVDLLSPEGPMSPMGPTTATRSFEVVGTFKFGFFEFDSGYGLVSLDSARSFLRKDPGAYDFIQIKVRDMNDAPAVAQRLRDRFGAAFQVQDWRQMNGSLYKALWLEKVAISLAIGLIIMVAALNIVASLVLLVMEKSRDIAILRTMGAPAKSIRRIFMLQGLVIGGVGTAAGTFFGVGASLLLDHYQVIQMPGDVYQITYLPFRVLPLDLTSVVVGAVLICFLATIYPARQAGRLDPAEALRYQ